MLRVLNDSMRTGFTDWRRLPGIGISIPSLLDGKQVSISSVEEQSLLFDNCDFPSALCELMPSTAQWLSLTLSPPQLLTVPPQLLCAEITGRGVFPPLPPPPSLLLPQLPPYREAKDLLTKSLTFILPVETPEPDAGVKTC